jgi:hypothetical protein
MKKIIFITLALLAVLTMSCADDSSLLPSKSISVWRSTNFTDSTMSTTFEYYELRFVSDNSIELWVKRSTTEKPEKVNQAYSYNIKNKVISIRYNDVISKGTLDKSTMSIAENGITLNFVKL